MIRQLRIKLTRSLSLSLSFYRSLSFFLNKPQFSLSSLFSLCLSICLSVYLFIYFTLSIFLLILCYRYSTPSNLSSIVWELSMCQLSLMKLCRSLGFDQFEINLLFAFTPNICQNDTMFRWKRKADYLLDNFGDNDFFHTNKFVGNDVYSLITDRFFWLTILLSFI